MPDGGGTGARRSVAAHLEAALEEASNDQERYHIRQALQYRLLTADDAETDDPGDVTVSSE